MIPLVLELAAVRLPVAVTCRVLGISRSGFDDAASRPRYVLDRVASLAEGASWVWGIAENLSPGVIERAELAGVSYASLHYNELSKLAGWDEGLCPTSTSWRARSRSREDRSLGRGTVRPRPPRPRCGDLDREGFGAR